MICRSYQADTVLLEYIKQHLGLIQANLDLRNQKLSFLNRAMFDLEGIYLVNIKTRAGK